MAVSRRRRRGLGGAFRGRAGAVGMKEKPQRIEGRLRVAPFAQFQNLSELMCQPWGGGLPVSCPQELGWPMIWSKSPALPVVFPATFYSLERNLKYCWVLWACHIIFPCWWWQVGVGGWGTVGGGRGPRHRGWASTDHSPKHVVREQHCHLRGEGRTRDN